MLQTMTQIGKHYGVDAKTVGQILYDLNLRDRNHPEHPGFPHDQVVVHGIARAFKGRTGDVYYKYDIERIREEFENRVRQVQPETTPREPAETPEEPIGTILQRMLLTLNHAVESDDRQDLYRLKADIADLYALLPR